MGRLGRPWGSTKPPCGLGEQTQNPFPTLPQARATTLTNRISDLLRSGFRRSTDQVTLGITAQSPFRAHIDKGVYDLDVGSGHPNGAAAIKGSFVQRLKSYVI